MRLAADKRSMGNPGARTSSSWMPVVNQPPADQLRAAADVLNGGRRVAILVGQGALNARAEVTEVADRLGAPVAKALLGKAVLADNSPFTTGGIGHLGTAPSSWAMKNCDAVLIVGSTMPWFEYYPKPGQARGVQIDMKPDRIGLRYPVEIGSIGDAKATLAGADAPASTSVRPQLSATRLSAAWQLEPLARKVEATARSPLRPQMVISAVSDLMADDAVVSLDCGANTHFAARNLMLRPGQRLTGTGMMAIDGRRLAVRDRRPTRLSQPPIGRHRRRRRVRHANGGNDDGGAARPAGQDYRPQEQQPRRSEVRASRARQSVIRLRSAPIDFVAFARACGEGFRCERPEEVRPAIRRRCVHRGRHWSRPLSTPTRNPRIPDELRI